TNARLARPRAPRKGGVPQAPLELVHLRASQINGCSFCVDSGARSAKKAGETDERLFAVAAWREAPYFTDAERAALALTEAVTRLADREDPGPDHVWGAVTGHYDDKQLAGPGLALADINGWKRLHAATRQGARAWQPEPLPMRCRPARRTPVLRDFSDEEARIALPQKWGAVDADVVPAWIAEMDFAPPEPVLTALREAAVRGPFGYPSAALGVAVGE